MKQILDIAADQFYTIGISLPANGYGIVKNNMHNVPTTILQAYLYPSPGPTNTFTYYFSS
jgi:peptide/nickel transport system substrate-binding protein